MWTRNYPGTRAPLPALEESHEKYSNVNATTIVSGCQSDNDTCIK